MRPPDEVEAALALLDASQVGIRVDEVHRVIARAIPHERVPEDRRAGWLAEWTAFELHASGSRASDPNQSVEEVWFQPLWRPASDQGHSRLSYSPEMVEYWAHRARAVSHPVLAARYADLAWEMSRDAKGTSRIESARRAIDNYLAATRMDGADQFDSELSLERALNLSLTVKDRARLQESIAATLTYAEKTAVPAQVGTYLYLFDHLLTKRGLSLTPEQERTVIERFEAGLANLAQPDADASSAHFRARELSKRLSSYYIRRGQRAEANRVQATVALLFERAAQREGALLALMHLRTARTLYLEAGLGEAADRVQRSAQDAARTAEGEMKQVTTSFEFPAGARDRFLSDLRACSVEIGLEKLVSGTFLGRDWLTTYLQQRNKEFPLQAMFRPLVVGRDGLQADLADTSGDPDGDLVFELARLLQIMPELSWGFEDLFSRGLTVDQVIAFVARSPIFAKDRLPLIGRGLEAHLAQDYVVSIHLLVPQVEHALVTLIYALGGSSTKAHQSGRGVTQLKNLNDVFKDPSVLRALGPDVHLHLQAVLSHPKGMNIRNAISHGLWGPEAFRHRASEWVLHALLATALVRESNGDSEIESNEA